MCLALFQAASECTDMRPLHTAWRAWGAHRPPLPMQWTLAVDHPPCRSSVTWRCLHGLASRGRAYTPCLPPCLVSHTLLSLDNPSSTPIPCMTPCTVDRPTCMHDTPQVSLHCRSPGLPRPPLNKQTVLATLALVLRTPWLIMSTRLTPMRALQAPPPAPTSTTP
jgi:hypothetical protein